MEGIFLRVRSFNPMMQMNLNLAPTRVAVFGQAVNQRLAVILCRIKIRVAQGLPFFIPPSVNCRRVLATPFFQSLLLFTVINTISKRVG
jgi:hypothetical protein